jgi:putative membrane protein
LSVSLFSARVAQHMVLTLVAAPLLALGRPVAAYAALAGRAPRRAPDTSLAAGAAFAVLLWFWHAPRPYTDTFLSTAVYWSMHLSLIGSAIWLWAELLDRPPSGGRIAAAGLSMVQMSLLGAILTLSQRALFPPHQLTTAAWGLTQLQDQALGGAIMWVPGGVIFLGVLLAKAWRLVQPSFAEGGALAGAGAALVPTEAPARP